MNEKTTHSRPSIDDVVVRVVDKIDKDYSVG